MDNKRYVQSFSVSQDYEEVLNILDRIDNKSSFICKAIIYYDKLEKEGLLENGVINKSLIKDLVREVLAESASESMYLLTKEDAKDIPRVSKIVNEKVEYKVDKKEELDEKHKPIKLESEDKNVVSKTSDKNKEVKDKGLIDDLLEEKTEKNDLASIVEDADDDMKDSVKSLLL